MFRRKEEVRDPVCGMKVKKEGSIKSAYLGEIYYFCSEYCKTEFEKNPGRYINTPSNKESHIHSFHHCC